MTIQEIQETVTGFLTEELEIDGSKISGDARLKEDLGIDSLEIVDVVVYVDQAFGFKMRPEDFREIKTFDDFDIDYNAQKYLIETRCSGALTKPFSAIRLTKATA